MKEHLIVYMISALLIMLDSRKIEFNQHEFLYSLLSILYVGVKYNKIDVPLSYS